MGTAMGEELAPRWPPWVARYGRPPGFFWLICASCDIAFLPFSSLAIVALPLFAIRTSFFDPSATARPLTLADLTWLVPVVLRAYEGFELLYLCRVKPGSGLIQTSNSNDPPE